MKLSKESVKKLEKMIVFKDMNMYTEDILNQEIQNQILFLLNLKNELKEKGEVRQSNKISNVIDLFEKIQFVDSDSDIINEELHKFIERQLDKMLNEINNMSCGLINNYDKLNELGLLDNQEKINNRGLRKKMKGAYNCCQSIQKQIKEEKQRLEMEWKN